MSISLTGSALIGTPAYMSPEQCKGVDIDERTDQYSFGIVLYQLFTGALPFTGETPMAVAVQHINEPLPRPRKFKPDLPEPVERVLMKALAKDPDARFESIDAMNTSLQGALTQSVDAFGRFVPQEARFNIATWVMERTPLGEPISTLNHWWNARRPAFVAALLFLMLLPTVGYALASMQVTPQPDPAAELSGGNDAELQATIDALSTTIAAESGEDVDPSLIQAAVAATLSAERRTSSGRPTVTPGLFATPTPTLMLLQGGGASLPEETATTSSGGGGEDGGSEPTSTPVPTKEASSTPGATATSSGGATETPAPTNTSAPAATNTPVPPTDPPPEPTNTPRGVNPNACNDNPDHPNYCTPSP